MIFIALGANLPSHAGPPEATLRAALDRIKTLGIEVLGASRLYRSAPYPAGADQPDYINAVASVATALGPERLLHILLGIEREFGRERGEKNAPRTLDLDLLAYGERVSAPGAALTLPHPRMHARAFVLLPLHELDPTWRHPATGVSLADMIAALDDADGAEPLADALPIAGSAHI